MITEYNIASGGISTYEGPPVDPIEVAQELVNLRTAAKLRIDAAAAACRLTFITDGAGQATTYQQKMEEAKAYIADTSLTADECPHIFAEVGLTGQTAWEVAQVVVNLHEIGRIKSAKIEPKRLAAKAAIAAAETAEAIGAAAMVDWDG